MQIEEVGTVKEPIDKKKSWKDKMKEKTKKLKSIVKPPKKDKKDVRIQTFSQTYTYLLVQSISTQHNALGCTIFNKQLKRTYVAFVNLH